MAIPARLATPCCQAWTIGFIAGTAAVAVIGPGGNGERLRARIRAATPLPVRYVMIAHLHPDHVFGAGAFEADRPVFVAHAAMLNMTAARGPHDRDVLVGILGDPASGAYAVPTMLAQRR